MRRRARPHSAERALAVHHDLFTTSERTHTARRRIIARRIDAGQIATPLGRPSLDPVTMMTSSMQQRHPALPQRLLACLAGSVLLHASTIALLAGKWPIAIRQPELAPVLHVRLPEPPPEPGSPPATEPLIKDTLSDAAAAAAVLPPRSFVAGEARPRAGRAVRERAAQRKLAKHLFYPPEAVAAGIEGEVRLLLTLDPAGIVVEAVIASSSGHPMLDRAALSAAHALRRLPGAGERELILPVVFRLE